MDLHPGSHLGPYELVGVIGAGGMGTVYRAKDRRLDREVAIKVLPETVAGDPDWLARFQREARALARLSHPSILAIHDVGHDGGIAYVVTELLRGETLRARLGRERLPWRKAVEIAAAVADGLASAHAHGIVHRDLKPENLFLTSDGQTRILDFGIARVLRPSGPDPETQGRVPTTTGPGVLMGTLGYMAPEQARGEGGDARSARDSTSDTLRAVMTEPLPEITDLGLGVPPDVGRIVAHCVEKPPDDRFQSARDLAFDLRATLTSSVGTAPLAPPAMRRLPWSALAIAATALTLLVALTWMAVRYRETGPGVPETTVADAGRRPTVVVLPFDNLGDARDAYFAAGMTEEVTSKLAGVGGLAVTSRTTAMEYDRKGKSLKTLGADLGVDYVLEGTVRWDRAGEGPGRVRITPQLIRVADDVHVWTATYDREMADVFALQSDVASEVVFALGRTLTPSEEGAMRRAPTGDLVAYDLYLKASRLFTGSYDANERQEVIRLLEQALGRDPQFAAAHALLARQHLYAYWFHTDHSPERLDLARLAAERAVSLGPEVPESHLAMAHYYYQGLLDYERALVEIQKAARLQPGSSESIAVEAFVKRRAGRVEEAATLLERAVGLDPGNATFQHNLAESYWLLRRYPEATRVFDRALALNPRWGREYSYKAAVDLCQTGNVEQARAVMPPPESRAALLDGLEVSERLVQFAFLARRYDDALRLLEDAGVEAFAWQHYYVPISRLTGDALRLKGDRAGAQRAYVAARTTLERELARSPDDSRFLTELGIVQALLGRRNEALRAATEGVRIMPLSREAYRGAFRLEDLARVNVILGDEDTAIDHLEQLLSRPGRLCASMLQLDPAWDPLRANPRFQALLAKHAAGS